MYELIVPSGARYTEQDIALLAMMGLYGFVRYDETPFTLRSGIQSHVYVFGREDLTDHPDLEWAVGEKIAQLVCVNTLPTDNQPCLIGIPTAGTALAQSAATVSWKERILTPTRNHLVHRMMREHQKEHGATGHQRKWVNGEPDLEHHTYWKVDNVVTDGGSKVEADRRFVESGYPALEMPAFVFVDRQQGGIERMRHAGQQRIVVAFKLLDIAFAFREMGRWPSDVVAKVEAEIQAHQFAQFGEMGAQRLKVEAGAQ